MKRKEKIKSKPSVFVDACRAFHKTHEKERIRATTNTIVMQQIEDQFLVPNVEKNEKT